jgi:hypothetical protein
MLKLNFRLDELLSRRDQSMQGTNHFVQCDFETGRKDISNKGTANDLFNARLATFRVDN